MASEYWTPASWQPDRFLQEGWFLGILTRTPQTCGLFIKIYAIHLVRILRDLAWLDCPLARRPIGRFAHRSPFVSPCPPVHRSRSTSCESAAILDLAKRRGFSVFGPSGGFFDAAGVYSNYPNRMMLAHEWSLTLVVNEIHWDPLHCSPGPSSMLGALRTGGLA